eukprot:scaffold5626_cov258-Ochromonas_danica.AAC.14
METSQNTQTQGPDDLTKNDTLVQSFAIILSNLASRTFRMSLRSAFACSFTAKLTNYKTSARSNVIKLLRCGTPDDGCLLTSNYLRNCDFL